MGRSYSKGFNWERQGLLSSGCVYIERIPMFTNNSQNCSARYKAMRDKLYTVESYLSMSVAGNSDEFRKILIFGACDELSHF